MRGATPRAPPAPATGRPPRRHHRRPGRPRPGAPPRRRTPTRPGGSSTARPTASDAGRRRARDAVASGEQQHAGCSDPTVVPGAGSSRRARRPWRARAPSGAHAPSPQRRQQASRQAAEVPGGHADHHVAGPQTPDARQASGSPSSGSAAARCRRPAEGGDQRLAVEHVCRPPAGGGGTPAPPARRRRRRAPPRRRRERRRARR